MGLWKDEPLAGIFFITGLIFVIRHIFLNFSNEILLAVFFLIASTYLIGHYYGKKEVKK